MDSPRALREAAALCRHLTGDALYECLKPYFGGEYSVKSLKEIFIRSTAIHMISLGAFGHLLSLQGLTSSSSRAQYASPLLFFLLYPEIALAQFASRAVRAGVQCYRGHFRSRRQFLASCFGIHILQARAATPIAEFNSEQIRPERLKYDLVWMGRMVVLLALLAQCIGTALVWLRRLVIYSDRAFFSDSLDARNVEMVFGGFWAVFNSLCILLINTKWNFVSDGAELDHVAAETISEPTALGSSVEVQSSVANDTLVPRDRKSSTYASSKMGVSRSLNDWNAAFFRRLDVLMSPSLQHDLENAFLVHYLLFRYAYGIFGYVQVRASPELATGCTSILQVISSHTHERPRCRTQDKLRISFWSFVFVHWTSSPYPDAIAPLTILYFVPLARIILYRLCALLAHCRGIGRFASRLRKALNGRTIPAFLLNLLMLVPVILKAVFIVRQAKEFSMTERIVSMSADRFDRLFAQVVLWKDPWYDNMYIL